MAASNSEDEFLLQQVPGAFVFDTPKALQLYSTNNVGSAVRNALYRRRLRGTSLATSVGSIQEDEEFLREYAPSVFSFRGLCALYHLKNDPFLNQQVLEILAARIRQDIYGQARPDGALWYKEEEVIMVVLRAKYFFITRVAVSFKLLATALLKVDKRLAILVVVMTESECSVDCVLKTAANMTG